MANQQDQPSVLEEPSQQTSSPSNPFPSDSTTEPSPPTSSSSSTASPLPENLKTCSNCNKPDSDAEKTFFKPCPKCQTTLYCSRECQKSGLKKHKKTCAIDAQEYAKNADLKMESRRSVPKKEGHRGGLQKWQFDT